MTALSPRIALAALIVTLLACGVWPYHEMLSWLPWGADASKWIANGSLDSPGWVRWVWATKHFVGYRPITALSFVIDHAVSGYSALGYRSTDLSLHLGTGALLFAAYRRLTGDRSALGLLAVVLLCGHPATEEVVPYAARRSYLLAMCGGLSALLLWLEALAPERETRARVIWAVLSALGLGLGVLSNEVAYVFFPLLPLLALGLGPLPGLWRSSPRAMLLLHLPPALVVSCALVARYAVLGMLGGYQRRYFALVSNGIPMWREMPSWKPWSILAACWEYLVGPNGVSGRTPLFEGGQATAVLVLATLWLGWVALGSWPLPARTDRRAAAPPRLLLVLWLLGSLGIVVLSQTWFWRQAHALLLPYAMLVALGLGDALSALVGLGNPLQDLRVRGPRLLLALGSLAAGLLLVASSLWNGPLWSGMDLRPHANTIAGTPLAHRMQQLLVPLPGDRPSTVWLVAPLRGNGAHILRLWGDRFGKRKKATFRLLANLRPAARLTEAELQLTRSEHPTLTLGKGFAYAPSRAMAQLKRGRTLEVDRLWRSRGDTWLFALDADDAWAIRVPKPEEGAALVPDEPEESPEGLEELEELEP